jgi:hypothetical protein
MEERLAEFDEVIAPVRLWSRSEVLAKPSPVPRQPGLYAWYFKTNPPGVPTRDCVIAHGSTMLYVGISPGRPPKNGQNPNTQTLRDRVRNHFRGNAEGSALRLTLGSLLASSLGIELRRVGSGKRMTFLPNGEEKLSEWMSENAFVTWVVRTQPWEFESNVIRRVSLPLNLDQNEEHPFHATLSSIRKLAKDNARQKPVVNDS